MTGNTESSGSCEEIVEPWLEAMKGQPKDVIMVLMFEAECLKRLRGKGLIDILAQYLERRCQGSVPSAFCIRVRQARERGEELPSPEMEILSSFLGKHDPTFPELLLAALQTDVHPEYVRRTPLTRCF